MKLCFFVYTVNVAERPAFLSSDRDDNQMKHCIFWILPLCKEKDRKNVNVNVEMFTSLTKPLLMSLF